MTDITDAVRQYFGSSATVEVVHEDGNTYHEIGTDLETAEAIKAYTRLLKAVVMRLERNEWIVISAQ